MPPLESLSAAMVTALNASGLTPAFTARWDYDTSFVMQSVKAADPIDVLVLPKGETTSILNRVQLGTELEIEIAIRAKLPNKERSTVLAIRELCDSIFYFWATPAARRIDSVNKVWLRTELDQAFDSEGLSQLRFQAVATLTFGITR